MRKFSTHIGVYAMLLIAAFYGSNSLLFQQQKPVTAVTTVAKKELGFSEEKSVRAAAFQQNEAANLLSKNSVSSLKNGSAGRLTELNFFNHSATIQHYINTL